MGGLDLLQVWHDPAIAGALRWYREVAANRKPAKFRIAATLPVDLDLDQAPEGDLWAALDRLTPAFLERWRAIRDQGASLGPNAPGPSLLDLCAELARRMLTHCNFCRWNCRVDRSRGGKLGACKLAAASRVSTYFHHPGEFSMRLTTSSRRRAASSSLTTSSSPFMESARHILPVNCIIQSGSP